MTPEEARRRVQSIYHEAPGPDCMLPHSDHYALNNLLQQQRFQPLAQRLLPADVGAVLAPLGLHLCNLDDFPEANLHVLGLMGYTPRGWMPIRRFGIHWVDLNAAHAHPVHMAGQAVDAFVQGVRAERGLVFAVVGEALPECPADALLDDDFEWPPDSCLEDHWDADSDLDDMAAYDDDERLRLAMLESEQDKYDNDLKAAIAASLHDVAPETPAPDRMSATAVAKRGAGEPGTGACRYLEMIKEMGRQMTESGRSDILSARESDTGSEEEGDLERAVRVSIRLAEIEAFERKLQRKKRKGHRRRKKINTGSHHQEQPLDKEERVPACKLQSAPRADQAPSSPVSGVSAEGDQDHSAAPDESSPTTSSVSS